MSTDLREALERMQDGRGLIGLSDEKIRQLTAQVIEVQREDRKENQLMYYQPVSEMANQVHLSNTRFIGVGGGNGASKTDTMLAEFSMHATGLYPRTLRADVRSALMAKFRGPVAIRIVVESITTTLHPIILPKLQWFKWNGVDSPGGDRGHWGWIPRRCLKNGSWQASWSEKLRMLTTLCFDPEDEQKVIGETTWQFMSFDQDPSDFASGDFHFVLHDELTTYPIWRENEARTMRVGGRMCLSMTWPDDPAIPVDWAYDLLYEKGRAGPNKHPDVDWFEMWSSDNPNLDQKAVAKQSEMWSDEIRMVRLKGQPIRFSNRVHPLFTDYDSTWCMVCAKPVTPVDGRCTLCGNQQLEPYNHVEDREISPHLPTLMLLDPHPRKPHMLMWVQVDTFDDAYVVAEALVEGEPEDVKATVDEVEGALGLNIAGRLGDPNMLRAPAGKTRGRSWQDEFGDVGLRIDLADDSDVGRGRVNDALKVDPDTGCPRLLIHPQCTETIRQLKRYVWADFKHNLDKAQKQTPKDKDDDFPTLLKYFYNAGLSFSRLVGGHRILQTRGQKNGRGKDLRRDW